MRKIFAIDHDPATADDLAEAASLGAPEIVHIPCLALPELHLGYNEVAEPDDEPPAISAQAALEATDLVAMRCFKAGVAFPQAWRDYVAALRMIVRGDSGAIPDQPAYPSGT